MLPLHKSVEHLFFVTFWTVPGWEECWLLMSLIKDPHSTPTESVPPHGHAECHPTLPVVVQMPISRCTQPTYARECSLGKLLHFPVKVDAAARHSPRCGAMGLSYEDGLQLTGKFPEVYLHASREIDHLSLTHHLK